MAALSIKKTEKPRCTPSAAKPALLAQRRPDNRRGKSAMYVALRSNPVDRMRFQG